MSGQEMTEHGAFVAVRDLIRDERFAGLLRLIDDLKEGYVDNISAPGNCKDHGILAHESGGLHACEYIVGMISQAANTKDQNEPRPT